MQQTIEFLNMLKGTTQVEFNNLNNVLKWNEIEGKQNIYFVAGLKEKLPKRCNDDDIYMKKYFAVDIDIRLDCYKETGFVLDNDELIIHMEQIIKRLQKAGMDDYSALVHSGNGLHIYYTGEERSFDKEVYSNGVKYIYDLINEVIKDTGYKCDPACHNIGRIMRLPGTLNPRKKIIKTKLNNSQIQERIADLDGERELSHDEMYNSETIYDLGDFECIVFDIGEKQSNFFKNIEEYAEIYKKELEREREDSKKIHQILKSDYKKSDDIWGEINNIPAREVACDIRPIQMIDRGMDNVALKESHKNMGAYWYRPTNVIVNTGSSLISTQKSYFTTYELVYYEYANQDKAKTLQYFSEKYNIHFKEIGDGIIIPKKEYEKIGYYYPGKVFDAFDCVMSGELMVIVALSNSGKTSVALNMIQANAVRGKKCFYINLEFPLEIIRQQRWLYLNGFSKKNLTDIAPLTKENNDRMNKYIKEQMDKFDSYSDPKGIELEDLVKLIVEKEKEGYGFFVVDTFSRIKGNLDSRKAHTMQNKSMEILQELCQNLGVVVVLLHHTNKAGEFEGSQKIMDLANVFLQIEREVDDFSPPVTKFTLKKDKFNGYQTIETEYINGEYLPASV